MTSSQLQILPGLWLDSRRAAFLERTSTLAIADLHLGYAWAHRFNGQLMPVHVADDWCERLRSLCHTYNPAHVVLLGDVVHQALPVPALKNELGALADCLASNCNVHLLLGNHDRNLSQLERPDSLHLRRDYESDGVLFIHGDKSPRIKSAALTIIGHEHPAISLGDGVTTSAKFPCFLISRCLIVLPAFSTWVAGTSFGHYPFMSSLARAASFQKAIAIMGSKLMPIPLAQERAPSTQLKP